MSNSNVNLIIVHYHDLLIKNSCEKHNINLNIVIKIKTHAVRL